MKSKTSYIVYNHDINLIEGIFNRYNEALKLKEVLDSNYNIEVKQHAYKTDDE